MTQALRIDLHRLARATNAILLVLPVLVYSIDYFDLEMIQILTWSRSGSFIQAPGRLSWVIKFTQNHSASWNELLRFVFERKRE